jgi:beta-lactamase class A
MFRILSVLFLLVPAMVSAAEPGLETRLKTLADAHRGKAAIALQHFPSGTTILLNPDAVMPTASLIKLPVMAEVYFQAQEGKVRLDEMLTLTKEEMVIGSGILNEHFSPGAKFSLRDTVRLMMVFSDNTATNMVLEKIGIPSTNARMNALGFPETRINAKVFRGSTTSVDPARTKQYGLGSTTAREMLGLLEMLHREKLVSPAACKAMNEHLLKCDDKEKFPRLLPKDVKIRHKTGSVSNARTDAGILEFPGGPVALVVLTNENEDQSWTAENAGNRLCAEVAKAVVDHFRTEPKKEPKK